MGLASRPGLVIQEVATWLGRPGGRDLACSVWCRDLDTIQVTVWTLFMSTIHRVKKKSKKKKKSTKFLKIFLCVISYMEYL